MLEAATALFLEKGFEQTSLSDIVARSKGSRTTLYELFGNKEGLLHAMIREATARVWEEVRWKDAPPALTEEGLVEVACQLLREITAPSSVSVFRIVFAEGRRMPDIVDLFLDSGPHAVRRQLADWFRAAQAEGRLAEGPAAEDLMEAFLGLILGDYNLRCGLRDEPADARDVERYVRLVVRIFLHGVGGASPG